MALNATPTRTAKSTDSIFDPEVREVARAGLPETRQPKKLRTAIYKCYVWVAVICFPLALMAVIATAAGGSSTEQTGTTGDQSATATSSPGRTAATLEIQSWLAGDNSPLPGGQILSWDKAVDLPAAKPQGGPSARAQNSAPVTYRTELDFFTLIDGKGRTYTATIQVAIDPRGGGAQALGGPSLTPTTPSAGDGWASGGPWPGLATSSQFSSSVQTAITGWATAYTSGSAESLRLAVGDTTAAHTYLPLTGVQSVTATPVVQALYGGKDSIIVEVTLNIVWTGQKVDPNATSDTNTPVTTMDLLVQRASTAAPVVVAWGPPGSGITLKPYGNAITAPAVGMPTSNPSFSDSPSPTPSAPTSS